MSGSQTRNRTSYHSQLLLYWDFFRNYLNFKKVLFIIEIYKESTHSKSGCLLNGFIRLLWRSPLCWQTGWAFYLCLFLWSRKASSVTTKISTETKKAAASWIVERISYAVIDTTSPLMYSLAGTKKWRHPLLSWVLSWVSFYHGWKGLAMMFFKGIRQWIPFKTASPV